MDKYGSEPVARQFQQVWGQRVNAERLPELFKENAPRIHVKKQHPPAGIDNLFLQTVDTFHVPGRGDYKIDFSGYFQVTRSEPSTPEWDTATAAVNFSDLKLFGRNDQLGGVTVRLNPDILSGGYTFPAVQGLDPRAVGVEACRIAVAAEFEFHDLNMTLFNKEPILLKNPDVQGIPTIGEGGKAGVYALPLYDKSAPDSLFGYLQELEYQVQNYMPRDEALLYRQSSNESEFRQLAVERGVKPRY